MLPLGAFENMPWPQIVLSAIVGAYLVVKIAQGIKDLVFGGSERRVVTEEPKRASEQPKREATPHPLKERLPASTPTLQVKSEHETRRAIPATNAMPLLPAKAEHEMLGSTTPPRLLK